MPIATAEREADDAQGSVGFFFHEGCDEHGKPSTKVFGVSSRRVLCEKIEGAHEFKGAGAPHHYVRVNGLRRFQRGLDEIKHRIGGHEADADLCTREIITMEAKGTSEDARALRRRRQNLDDHIEAIAELKKFYNDVKMQWANIEHRNIGHVHYSPPVSVDVQGEQYTEDWGTFELEEAKFGAQFEGNVVDLGAF